MIATKNEILKASILMMVSLFLPLAHNFISSDLMWSFPYFDANCECFSFNPKGYRSYPIKAIVPFYFAFGVVPIYIYCRELVPQMILGVFNLWSLHFIYYTIQAVDIFIAFGTIQYYRTAFILVGIALHVKFLLNTYKEK
jgi:hypothetical protein